MMVDKNSSRGRLQVHGHRGCRGLRPENTLPAFLHAAALGVDVLEMDVVVSADGQVVVSHEPWMNPAICLDPAGQRIPAADWQRHNLYQLSYAAIQTYDCGSLQHPLHPGQHCQAAYKPLLTEVVQQVDEFTQRHGRPAIHFSIEVKSSPAGDGIWHPTPEAFVRLVGSELLRLNILPRTTLLCFDQRVLHQARQLYPELALCLLVEDTRPLEEHMHSLGFVPEVYGPSHELVTPKLMEQAMMLGMQVVPWTVNNPGEMLRMIQLGVAGLTTDYPDHLLACLTSLGKAG